MVSSILPLQLSHTDQFTSEEIIQKAISRLEDRRNNVNAAISVLKKKLKSIKMLSQEVPWPEYLRMKSIPYSSCQWDSEVKPSSIAEAGESQVNTDAPKGKYFPIASLPSN